MDNVRLVSGFGIVRARETGTFYILQLSVIGSVAESTLGKHPRRGVSTCVYLAPFSRSWLVGQERERVEQC